MKIYDVCIIGAGASGLMAASYLSKSDLSILVLEGTKEVGKKLSLTGNGRCNITNENIRSSCFFSSDDSFVSNIFEKVPNERLLEELKKLSISVKNVNGYYYPYSFSAKSVVKAFSYSFLKDNVELRLESKVREIKYENETFYLYGERSSKEEDRPLLATAKKLILSCGGESYPKTGSDGAGYKLLYRLGHSLNKTLPALCPLKVSSFDKNLSGLRQIAKNSLYIDGRLVRESEGEVQFTKEGLSGICIFELSSPAIRAMDSSKEVEIKVDYLPDFSEDDLRDELSNRFNQERSVFDSLSTLMPDKLLNHVISAARVSGDMSATKLSENEIEAIYNAIKVDSFVIEGNDGFKAAQTTSGGVNLDEIDENMMSKLIPNLYVTGELLDVDGICGGYNLYLAFSTAVIASDRIMNK